MSYYYGNQGGGGGFGIPLQWIIGGIIAIVGFFLYFTHTSVNPITGEKQHVDLTPNQEIALGMQSAPQMASEMGGEVPPNDPQSQEIQYIGSRIWHRSQANDSPYPEQRMRDINAWIQQHYPNGVPSGLADPPLPWARG